MNDLVVIGGGPAGLAAAIEGRIRGLSVTLLEPRRYPIDKSCGEGLMPAALRSLKRLGVDLPTGIPFAGIRILNRGAVAVGHFAGTSGLGVRRTDLSRALLDRAVSVGVDIRRVRVRDVTLRDMHVELRVSPEQPTIKSRWVVAADGLHSFVRKALDQPLEHSGRQRWGVRAHFRTKPWTDYVEIYCSDAGEAYVTPVDTDTVGVALLSDEPVGFEAQYHLYPDLLARLGDRVGRDLGAGPFPRWMRNRSVGRVLFVGDAAGFADPITGEGVQLGLAAAHLALDAITTNDTNQYDRAWIRATRNYRLITRGILAVRRNPVTDRLMVPVLRSAPAIFDGLLGLLGGSKRTEGFSEPLSYQTTTLGGSSVLPPHSTINS